MSALAAKENALALVSHVPSLSAPRKFVAKNGRDVLEPELTILSSRLRKEWVDG